MEPYVTYYFRVGSLNWNEAPNFAVVGTGLAAGERVVVSDLIPAVGGMLLAPVVDADATRALIAEAEGRGPVR